MPDEKLSKLLEQLHAELGKVNAVDDRGRELLRALNADIQKLLERADDGQADESMLERLRDAVDHFEVTHPDLTSALSHMLTILSNAGI